MKDIIIKAIPHADQAYDTLGDYREDASALKFFVSQEMGDDYCFLVTIHELIESYLCKKRGIAWAEIDQFDIRYEHTRVNVNRGATSRNNFGYTAPVTNESEPGDEPTAPYYKEHQFASAIERMLAHELGVDWHKYEQDCFDILEAVDHKDRHNV